MKIEKQSLFIGLAIGAVMGGAIIGYLDANRPEPLFSSADEMGSIWIPSFESCPQGYSPTGAVRTVKRGGIGGSNLTLKECTNEPQEGGGQPLLD